MTVLFGAILLAGNALAFAPGPTNNNDDPFNPTDFLPSCNPNVAPPPNLDLNSPTTAAAPVPKTCTETSGPKPVTVTWVSDTVSGSATDNAWGQGDKSDCFLAKTGGVNGACVTQVNGIGASKTDLQYNGIGLAKGVGGDDYLYSGIKRLQAGGVTSSNANYNVEVNQLLPAYKPATPICPLVSPATGGCNMWRSPGDLTFMTDWGGNQSSCNTPTPAICAYVWIDTSTGTGAGGVVKTPNSGTCFNASAPPCWGTLPGGSAALSANPDLAAGSINDTAAVQPSTFSEIGVDLTKSGLVPPGACETFKNVWAHSRSSSSFSAELKDFIFGNVSLSTCTGTTTTLHERNSAAGTTDVTPANNGGSITVNPGAFVNDVATVTGTSPTGSVAFTYYPNLAACQAGTGGTAAGGGTVTSGGSSTSSTVQFNSTGTVYWQAVFTGTGGTSNSSSTCGDEILTIRQNSTTGTTLHERTDAGGLTDVNPQNNGGSITVNPGAFVNDTVGVLPTSATGSVAFTYYPNLAACQGGTGGTAAGGGIVSNGSSTSTTVQFNSTGTVYWQAVFTGTGLTNSSSSTCGDEILTIRQNSTTGTTLHERTDAGGLTDVNPQNNGGSISVKVGAYVNDTVGVLPTSATGSVAFTYYPTPADCTNKTNGIAAGGGIVSNGNFTSSTVQFNTVGTFYWQAVFTGTGLTNSSSSTCGDEILHVVQVNTAISTAPWYYPNDAATLSAPNGGGTMAGSIVFKLYDTSANCLTGGATGLLYTQSSQSVTGAGPFSTSNTSVMVSTSTKVFWNVTFTSTNKSQIGRNSVCVEAIDATLTGDSAGTVGNTP